MEVFLPPFSLQTTTTQFLLRHLLEREKLKKIRHRDMNHYDRNELTCQADVR
jgi:hypothetical protein